MQFILDNNNKIIQKQTNASDVETYLHSTYYVCTTTGRSDQVYGRHRAREELAIKRRGGGVEQTRKGVRKT